jgi:hypothetical protein
MKKHKDYRFTWFRKAVGFLDERFIDGIWVRHEGIGSCPTLRVVIDI